MDNKITVTVEADLEDIVPIFLDNRRDDITTMIQSVGSEDYEGIRVIGHSMKGAGGGYGFDYVTEVGHFLETAASNRDRNTIESLISQLQEYLDRLDIVFQ